MCSENDAFGYCFIAPALFLIFTFGIFPVAFALFVSLHKWRIVRTDFVGLANYVRAIGNLAYVAAFFLAVGALIAGYLIIKKIVRTAREFDQFPYLLAIPGAIYAWVVYAFLQYIWYQLPEFLDIAGKLLGVEKTRPIIPAADRGSILCPPGVLFAWIQFRWILLASILAGILAACLVPKTSASLFPIPVHFTWISLGTGLGLLYFTYQQITAAYSAALETQSDRGSGPR